jgi:hypothetical protein
MICLLAGRVVRGGGYYSLFFLCQSLFSGFPNPSFTNCLPTNLEFDVGGSNISLKPTTLLSFSLLPLLSNIS